MRNLRWYHRLTLFGACMPAAVFAAIFKCSGPHGHWHYSDHRPADCRGRLYVIARGDHAARPRTAASIRPSPAARLAWLRADQKRWSQTLRALLATPIPRDGPLRTHRARAIERIEIRLRYDMTHIKMLARRSYR